MPKNECSPSASRSDLFRTSNPNFSAVDLNQKYTPSEGDVLAVIDSSTKPIISERNAYLKKRMEENSAKLLDATDNFYKLSLERGNSKINCGDGSTDLLAKRQNDKAILVGLNITPENSAPQISLPEVQKLPRYTTWIFSDRNQRMPEDQTVAGQRQICYDKNGEEILISSDSEEDTTTEEEEQEENKEFVQNEDCVLRRTIDEMGSDDLTLGLLSQRLSRTPAEIKERYEYLIMHDNVVGHVNTEDTYKDCGHSYIDKDLATALDTFDILFCRRCLVFDCRLHGCSQDLIFPAEKQGKWSNQDAEKEPCGPACHQLVLELNAEESVLPAKNKKQKTADFDSDSIADVGASNESDTVMHEDFAGANLGKQKVVDSTDWKPFEKALYEKGIEIFGQNSCLIARNLLSGSKSCSEIFKWMQQSKEMSQDHDGNEAAGASTHSSEQHTYKSSTYKSFRKQVSEKSDQLYPHYTPCGCKTACGDSCPCFANGTCCEKYCGCPKSCQIRFRGCYCTKNECQSRQCPCFASSRECDPDVCRNCDLSCGDGTLVAPFQGGSTHECKNMKLQLRQHQKVLLGKSDVNGWGAFLKDSVGKDTFLGEYTGEVISHAEAEKRGKIYDRVNSSFLFNLNDELVLDARRMGNKLKFANHSPNPNCYPKVVMVAGDHRVGIFSKKQISAGEELLYDYHYEPDTAPPWLKELQASGSSNKRAIGKRDTGAPSSSRHNKKNI